MKFKLRAYFSHNWRLCLILLLSTTLRFWNYEQRWIFNQDQARDVIIATYAIRQHKLPLVGSPSSAGPFNFGALYDWLVVIITSLFPFTSGPWVAFTLLSIFSVLLFYKIGVNLGSKKLALILALIAGLSPQLILNSTDMLNTVAVLFAVSLNFYFLSVYITSRSLWALFSFAFSVGLANNFHFQSLGFGSILISFFILTIKNLKQFLKTAVVTIFGYLLSFLPNLIFDITHHFVWLKSVFHYYFGGGTDKFYYPVRWLTDIRDFWPQLWGDTLTGFPFTGYILIFIYMFFLFKVKNKKLKSYNLILLLSLIIQVFLLRYYKGVRSREYLITFHSYFIIFTALSFHQLLQKSKLAYLVIFSFSLLGLFGASQVIKLKSQAPEILSLYQQIGDRKISFYTKNGSSQLNFPLFYLYYRRHQIGSQAYKIATCRPSPNSNCPESSLVIASSPNYLVYDVNSLPDGELEKYSLLTPKIIYNYLYINYCLLYTSPSPRDRTRSRMPSSA